MAEMRRGCKAPNRTLRQLHQKARLLPDVPWRRPHLIERFADHAAEELVVGERARDAGHRGRRGVQPLVGRGAEEAQAGVKTLPHLQTEATRLMITTVRAYHSTRAGAVHALPIQIAGSMCTVPFQSAPAISLESTLGRSVSCNPHL